MNSLLDVFKLTDKLIAYLKGKGFVFTSEGYPVFAKPMFLTEIPDLIVPVQQRKNRRVKDKKRTVVSFFCGDDYIYRRLVKLLDEIDEYKEYMGVIGADVTVTKDMDLEWQRAIILLNQLVMAVFAANGIKIILNTRMGLRETKDIFRYMPRGIMIASGFRGGDRKYSNTDFEYVSKVLSFLPSRLLIYGRCHKSVLKRLDTLGIEYVLYKDFRDLCREVA
ncbi:MAG: DUF4417 domain-containing protein [Lachnospiraceae bacterium]|nr:DUF4417 domain-containing protein [Lachnospiraceae bacterium]